MLSSDFVCQVVGDGKLQEMTGYSFVAKNGPRLFDCGANVKILRVRIVSGDEIKTGRTLS